MPQRAVLNRLNEERAKEWTYICSQIRGMQLPAHLKCCVHPPLGDIQKAELRGFYFLLGEDLNHLCLLHV